MSTILDVMITELSGQLERLGYRTSAEPANNRQWLAFDKNGSDHIVLDCIIKGGAFVAADTITSEAIIRINLYDPTQKPSIDLHHLRSVVMTLPFRHKYCRDSNRDAPLFNRAAGVLSALARKTRQGPASFDIKLSDQHSHPAGQYGTETITAVTLLGRRITVKYWGRPYTSSKRYGSLRFEVGDLNHKTACNFCFDRLSADPREKYISLDEPLTNAEITTYSEITADLMIEYARKPQQFLKNYGQNGSMALGWGFAPVRQDRKDE